LSILICAWICIIIEKATAERYLDDSLSALFLSLLGTTHMPKYQCTKATQKLHNVVTNLEISIASVIGVDIDVLLLHSASSLDEIGEPRQKMMTLMH